MIRIGKTARQLRESLGLTQRAAAEALGVSSVHLCNVENDKSLPSSGFLDKCREVYGADLYVLAWCETGDVRKLPKAVQLAASELARIWKAELNGVHGELGHEG